MPVLPRSLLAAAALIAVAWNAPAHALSMHECSVKYRAAQSAGTLNGMSWQEFRKAECGAGAAAGVAPGPQAKTSPSMNRPMFNSQAPQPNMAPARNFGNAVFPTAISPKYADKSAGKGRMLTCLDQYKANKQANLNGGLRWIERGGGYYSLCNKRLKAAGGPQQAIR